MISRRIPTTRARRRGLPAPFSTILALVLVALAPAAAWADLDGDGFVDAVFANDGSTNRLCLGDGAGGFSGCSDLSADTLASRDVALGDVDGDNDLDAVFANLNQANRLCVNGGSGSFTCANLTAAAGATHDVALGDVDGDNDLDAVFAVDGTLNRLCTNDGSGSFTCANFIPVGSFSTRAVALGDVDGDNDIDAVFGQWAFAELNRVCTNDGSGSFTCANLSADTGQTNDVALGDVDGDNDLDAVFANAGQSRVCTNDGSGSFTCANIDITSGTPMSVALGDVDGDTDLDVVFGKEGGGSQRVCTNDGSGSFTCADFATSLSGRDVALRDLDGDNDLDAVLAGPAVVNRACTNDGSGGFTCSNVSADTNFTYGVALSPSAAAGAPELSIAAAIPAAQDETVGVPVVFTANGAAIAGTAFSIDYDGGCLFFDDTDFNPVDGIPDDFAVQAPAGFTVTVSHNAADADGEIDVSIVDLTPPTALLVDGPLATATFTATCAPAVGSTTTAPVAFSSDPAATFSDSGAQDVTGTTSDGSVEIFPGSRGDCNSSGSLSVADLVADVLEIFDGDGTLWTDVQGGSYPGSPVGCDANADTQVTAGDVSCTIQLLFGSTCGGAARMPDLRPPRLILDGSAPTRPGRVTRIPVRLDSGGHAISSLAFSLDLKPKRLRFDAGDRDGDGIPDALRFAAGRPWFAKVTFEPRDRDGELDVVLAAAPGTALADGMLLVIEVEVVRSGNLIRGLRFSRAPATSFGDVNGQGVPGRAVINQRPNRRR